MFSFYILKTNHFSLSKKWSFWQRLDESLSLYFNFCCWEVNKHTTYKELLERIDFWGKWHFFGWFSMVQDRFSKIKTNFENFLKIWKMLNFEAVWWSSQELWSEKWLVMSRIAPSNCTGSRNDVTLNRDDLIATSFKNFKTLRKTM